jgi:hypothetical protein
VLLPIRVADGSLGYRNGSVLVAGGPEGSSYASRVDGYDPIQNTWGIIGDMGVARTHTSAVVLPDARVLIVGGTAPAVDSYHGRAHYVDPLNAFAMSEGGALALDPLNATQAEARGYHTVSLLLPDGRVLHGGGRHGGYLERATIRFYSPPYMFQERPVIDSAPGAVGYGQVFRVYWSGSETMQVVDAAFLGLGSMTHSFDSNQRHVQALVVGAGTDETGRFVDVVAPPSPRWAPPGPYMLFVLDANRVPSVASMVAVN